MDFITEEDFVFDIYEEMWHTQLKNGSIKIFVSARGEYNSEYVIDLIVYGKKDPIRLTKVLNIDYSEAILEKNREELLQWGINTLKQIQYISLLFIKNNHD